MTARLPGLVAMAENYNLFALGLTHYDVFVPSFGELLGISTLYKVLHLLWMELICTTLIYRFQNRPSVLQSVEITAKSWLQ